MRKSNLFGTLFVLAVKGVLLYMNKKIKKRSMDKDKLQSKQGYSKASKKAVMTDWFYMTPSDIDAKNIAQLLETECGIFVELWEKMNILQIELSDKTTIDFERIRLDFTEPSDIEFIKSRKVHTIFALYIESGEISNEFKNILKAIVNRWEGFLCADSQDFQPIYSLDNL